MNGWIKEVAALDCRDAIERIAGAKFDRSSKTCCPLPGHIEKTPSFSINKKTNRWKCFGCGEGGDCIDFTAKYKGMDNAEAARFLADLYGIGQLAGQGKNGAGKVTTEKKPKPYDANAGLKTGVKEYLESCERDIGYSGYFVRRGLSKETIAQFRLGYDAKKDYAVIPYSSELNYYQTRSVDGKEFRKPSAEQAGQEPVFNAAALKEGGLVFVVESPICAMSIVQCGGAAIALGGTGIQKLTSEVKDGNGKCTFILCLDNDPPGRRAQQDLADQLSEMNARFIVYNIAEGYKDPNELLMAEPKALSANIRAAVAEAKKQFSKLKRLFSAGEKNIWVGVTLVALVSL